MANPSKNKGTCMETWTVRYLAWALQDTRIDRMPLKGDADQGDLAGVRYAGETVCVECKDTKQPQYRRFWQRTLEEAANMDAPYAVLVRHRRGVGVKSLNGMARQMAVMDTAMAERFLDACRAGDDFKAMVRREARAVRGTPTLVWMPLELFALILNHGLPLGPEDR